MTFKQAQCSLDNELFTERYEDAVQFFCRAHHCQCPLNLSSADLKPGLNVWLNHLSLGYLSWLPMVQFTAKLYKMNSFKGSELCRPQFVNQATDSQFVHNFSVTEDTLNNLTHFLTLKFLVLADIIWFWGDLQCILNPQLMELMDW